jgi:hypothetical protein
MVGDGRRRVIMQDWSEERRMRAHQHSAVPVEDCEQCMAVGHACRECYAESMAHEHRRWARHQARRSGHPSVA